MAARRSWYILGLVSLGLVPCSGCMVASTAVCNVFYETRNALDDCLERQRNRSWAEAAWKQVCPSNGWGEKDDDYARGFKEGFADYLYRGTVEPPILPPPRYRSLWYQSPQGHAALEQWRAGFRHGVSVAKESGYRRYVTWWVEAGVPPGQPIQPLPPPGPGPLRMPTHPAVPSAPLSVPELVPAPSERPAEEVLPLPRPAPQQSNGQSGPVLEAMPVQFTVMPPQPDPVQLLSPHSLSPGQDEYGVSESEVTGATPEPVVITVPLSVRR